MKPDCGALTTPRLCGTRTEFHIAGACKQRMFSDRPTTTIAQAARDEPAGFLCACPAESPGSSTVAGVAVSTMRMRVSRRPLRTVGLGPLRGKLGSAFPSSSSKMLNSSLPRRHVSTTWRHAARIAGLTLSRARASAAAGFQRSRWQARARQHAEDSRSQAAAGCSRVGAVSASNAMGKKASVRAWPACREPRQSPPSQCRLPRPLFCARAGAPATI